MLKRIVINVRTRLIASLLSIVAITGIASIIIGYTTINKNILGQAYDVLIRDINTAQYIYENNINSINLLVKHIASSPISKRPLLKGIVPCCSQARRG